MTRFISNYYNIASWEASIVSHCDGSASGTFYTVHWQPPPYLCTDNGAYACMNATVDLGGIIYDAPADPMITVRSACATGYYIEYGNPPDQGDCNCGADGERTSKQGETSTPYPINVGSGNENLVETDYSSGDGRLVLKRIFNSSNPIPNTSMQIDSQLWQNNFEGRRIVPLIDALPPHRGITPEGFSSLVVRSASDTFSDPATACTSGWAQIAATSFAWAYVSAAYDAGSNHCLLSNGAVLTVYKAASDAAYTSAGGTAGVALFRGDGSVYKFECNAGVCTPQSDVPFRMTASPSGFVVTTEDDTVEIYDVYGLLQSITKRGGYEQTLAYSNSRLASVTDSFGRSLTFNQDGSVSTPDGSITFVYDGSFRLISVTYPDISVRRYTYNDLTTPSLVTGVIDESGNNYLSTSYDYIGRATSSGLAAGVGASTVDFTDPTNPVVTDAFGVARTYHYTRINGRQKISSITGAATCLTCRAPASTGYDAAGYLASTTDWNGNLTQYTYDDTRGLETSRIEAVGTAQQRTITTTWHPNFRLPSEIDEPGRQTTFTYDGSGNLLTKTVKDTSTNASRTWTYSNYTAWGMPQTIDGPRTDVSDVTQVAYYPIAANDPKSGQVHTVTDALGHLTSIDNYDGSGRPLQITDPNGLVTALSYFPRGWLKTRQAGSELTQYDYYPTGLLKTLSLPDGRSLQYSYNAAHQLTQVADQLGDKIVYTPDAMGNNTQVQVFNPNGTLVQTHSRAYNNLDELYQDISAQNHATTYGYDNNGNLTSVTDPLNHQTVNTYDALDRLHTATDPTNGLSQYAYNALDQLVAVTDPRTLSTIYTTDALDNTANVASPDSGNTGAGYDAAGNVLSRTDNKNQATQYQYDALNRLVLATRAGSSTASYTWDQNDSAHGYGIGHLTHAVDSLSGATLDWSYDLHGRVIQRSQTIGSVTLVTSYGYSATTGQLQSMTLPSGKVIAYTWTNGQLTALKLNGASLVSAVAYQPFGGPIGWTLSNGETASRSYDLDGRLASDPLETVGYDDASRINGWTLTNLNVFSGNASFGYDNADRVNSYTITGTSLAYTYDANGNRSGQTVNGTQTSNTLDTASNRLLRTPSSASAFIFDANGSRTGQTGSAATFSYDSIGRLKAFSTSYASATYAFDALNRRVQKVVTGFNAGTVSFAYDESGKMLGEYSATGQGNMETVYLGDIPVALLRTSATYAIHADYRNTPRQLDNASRQAVWSWTPNPFGENAPNNNPLGLSTQFNWNARFPGQYLDKESGVAQNMYRNYELSTGRYLESDPIGLGGGINTYAYVDGNPIMYIDPDGNLASLPDWVVDGAAGWGDMVSFGLTNQARNLMGTNDVVNKCSWGYRGGEALGFANDLAIGWAGGARSAVKGWGNFSHSLFPNRYLKQFDNGMARWLNQRGNRLNGDFMSWEQHASIDPWAYRFASQAWKDANELFPAWRQALNRIPYFPASAAYGAGSAAINSGGCGCSN
jgi:RHS repeat-associated protein